jgi:hypothetical protein
MAEPKRPSRFDRYVRTKSGVHKPHDPAVSFGDDQASRVEVDRSQRMGVQFVNS